MSAECGMRNAEPGRTLRRELAVETRVLDAKAGIVEYVASDESVDSYREVIRLSGWRFDRFQKNAPFVDSHDYGTIAKLLGNVIDFRVVARRLVETVKWAIDAGLPEDHLTNIGWRMTQAGYLKAVSVGFVPERLVTKWDQDPTGFNGQLKELGLDVTSNVRVVYLEQQQLELSSVIIGANPNALQNVAKAFKAGVIDDAALTLLSGEFARRETPASVAPAPAHATDEATAQARRRFLERIETIIKKI